MIKILHIDDEVGFLKLTKTYLSKLNKNYYIDCYDNPIYALEALEERTYDIILSDYSMPNLDGISLLKKIRKMSDIPFIMVTGKGRKEVVIQALNNGADYYLQKGIDTVSFFSQLNNLIFQSYQKRKSTSNFKLVLDLIEAIVWEIDVYSFEFTFVSEQAERILGFPTNQWLGDPFFWESHIHPDDRETALNCCAMVTAQLKDHQFEYRFFKADGSIAWIKNIVTVKSIKKKPVKLRGLMIDITKEKETSKKLIDSEMKYKQLLDNISFLSIDLNDIKQFSQIILAETI